MSKGIVVPTIEEIVGRGRSPRFAVAVVAGERAKEALLKEKPDATEVELFEAGEAALERKLQEIFGEDFEKAVDERVKAFLFQSPNPTFTELKAQEPQEVLALLREGVELLLDLGGHVPDARVQAWMGKLDALATA